MAVTETEWRIKGDYFENCNCDVVCPCLFSPLAPFASTPTQGACEVAFAFHIDEGSYGEASLDGLNVAVAGRSVVQWARETGAWGSISMSGRTSSSARR